MLFSGDHTYKQNTELSPEEQIITACPDIKEIELTKYGAVFYYILSVPSFLNTLKQLLFRKSLDWY